MVSFSDIVSLNTICPSTVFSIIHLRKQAGKTKGQHRTKRQAKASCIYGGVADPKVYFKSRTMHKFPNAVILGASSIPIKKPFLFQ